MDDGAVLRVQADDPDLRAHLLADFAVQHLSLGYPGDCLRVARWAAVDERVTPPVTMVGEIVKARAWAAAGDTRRCREHIAAAERQQRESAGATGWQATIATEGHLSAGTGHAAAVAAARADDPELQAEAQARLAAAVEALDPATHTRAYVLCVTALAGVRFTTDDLTAAVAAGRQAIQAATEVRSQRVTDALRQLRAVAGKHAGAGRVDDLLADLDAASGPRPPGPSARPDRPTIRPRSSTAASA